MLEAEKRVRMECEGTLRLTLEEEKISEREKLQSDISDLTNKIEALYQEQFFFEKKSNEEKKKLFDQLDESKKKTVSIKIKKGKFFFIYIQIIFFLFQ